MRQYTFGFLTMLLFATCIACTQKQGNDAVVEENNEKFANRDEEKVDAKFVVHAMENAYANLQLAKLGAERAADEHAKALAKDMIDAQQTVVKKLEEYAQSNDVTMPVSTDELSADLKRLSDETENFDRKWSKAMADANNDMIDKFADYEEKADGSLKEVVAASLASMRGTQDKLKTFIGEDDK